MASRTYTHIVRAALAAAFVAIAAAAQAADAPGKQGANADPAKRGSSPRTEAVAQAALADQIARHADRTKDVLAMIAAARLLGQVSPRTVKHEMKTEGAAKPTAGGSNESRDTTVAALLARAKQYAGGRNDLNGVIEEVSRFVAKGKEDGPARVVNRIQGGATDVYTISFNGNEPAMAAITGEGLGDLDLFVEDDKGNQICRSTSAVDDEICRWTPRWNGAFRVRVRNIGNVLNEYRLWTN
jgi:hypothetical protein